MTLKTEGARVEFIRGYLRVRNDIENALKSLDASRNKLVQMRTYVQDTPDVFKSTDYQELSDDLSILKTEIKKRIDAMG